MGIFKNIVAYLNEPMGVESKGYINAPARRTDGQISALVAADFGGFADDDNFTNSVVYACARVIAEGLALPDCYVHQNTDVGRKIAMNHPLFPLLNASPNARQTSYEMREFIGFHLALYGNAYVYINRNPRGQIVELLPCDPGFVSVSVDQSELFRPLTYYLLGTPVPASKIWHIKGPSWLTYQGQNTVAEARSAISLANANETYGANLFKNGAKPGALISPETGTTMTEEMWSSFQEKLRAQTGVSNAHKPMVLNIPMKYQEMASTANDAQWIESRRFQIEEICRYFRVSPAKVFQNLGSQSYASVEQAHIAHQFDTDAQWQKRFVQSATQSLLSPADIAAGYKVTIDDRSILNGTTASERMAYWVAGVAGGIFTQNEARVGENYDPVADPEADKLKQAVNIMPPPPIAAKSPDETADDTPKKV